MRENKKEQLPNIFSMIDKLAKKNIIHINKAARLKNKFSKKFLSNKSKEKDRNESEIQKNDISNRNI